jgi:LmbE family N-acetylglucosaminyl deacetylase
LLDYWAAGFEITVISAFSGASVSTFRYADKLPVSASELRTIRESENTQALTAYLPFRVQQLGLPTAGGRGYARAFAEPLATDAARLTVQNAVRSLDEDPVMLFAPAGFGGHADHLLLREIGLNAFSARTVLYEEAPYVREDCETAGALAQQGWVRRARRRSESSFDIKVAVVSHYLSQLPVRSRAELVRYIEGWDPHNPTHLEAFWRLPDLS